MALSISPSDYDRIRRALSVSLDAGTLPDLVIEDESFLPSGIAWVVAQTTDEGAHAKNAAIFYTAALLAPSMAGQISAAEAIVVGNGRPIDVRVLAGELRARAQTELFLVST